MKIEEKKETKKAKYEKPTLVKHGKLTDMIAGTAFLSVGFNPK